MLVVCGTGILALMLGIIIVTFLIIGSYNFDKERAEMDKERANTKWKEIDGLLKTGRYELIFTPNFGWPLLKLKDVNIKEKEK